MARMTWFWRLVCSPDCDAACQTSCPGCHDMAGEWESQGHHTIAAEISRPRLRWSRLNDLWSCWSRSVSARMLRRLRPAWLGGHGAPAATEETGCGCHQPAATEEPAAGAACDVACGCRDTGPQDVTIKEGVRRYYSARAAHVMASADEACCGPAADAGCTTMYAKEDLDRIPSDAIVASLGCGNPLALADLRPGETVLDLGSGGGMDVFVAAGRVAPGGRVYGLDMSDEMLALARANAVKIGATNVEFLKGDLESIPLPDGSIDVIVSNCVVNLSPDKRAALSEAYRVLRPGGRLAISDIVTRDPVPAVLREDLTAWAACIGGALSQEEYRDHLHAAGFVDVMLERGQEYTERDAALAGLDPLLKDAGMYDALDVGFASTGICAIKRAKEPASGSARKRELLGASTNANREVRG